MVIYFVFIFNFQIYKLLKPKPLHRNRHPFKWRGVNFTLAYLNGKKVHYSKSKVSDSKIITGEMEKNKNIDTIDLILANDYQN